MRNFETLRSLFALLAAMGLSVATSDSARAHCDGIDGPVVRAAQTALAKGDVNLVLIWVKKDDEAPIRRAFDQTLAVRKQGAQAKELADMYFFETLVRIHRAGEGAPYTGLKPAGRDGGPAVPAADLALESGDIGPLTKLLLESMRSGLAERYERALKARAFNARDVDAGREYIEAYVAYIHYVDGVYEASTNPEPAHHPGEAVNPHEGHGMDP